MPHNKRVTSTNERKRRQLGMAWGTANGRLQRKILFHLVQRLEEDKCFHCGKTIETVSELSVEHKEPWLDVDVELFWDLENIAFSHHKCNIAAARRPNKIEWPNGKAWCWECKQMKSLEDFPPSKSKRRTLSCCECASAYRARWRQITGKH